MNILEAMDDAALFAPWFRDAATWATWRAFLAALFGLPLTPEQLELYRQCTGRSEAPSAAAIEAWLICGRRAGKSFVMALVAVYLGCFRDYRAHLAPGERAMVLVVAVDRRQARIVHRYARALLTNVPMLKKMVERETADGFDITNGVSIEIGTASYRSLRGYTLCAALLDEIAFYPTDDAAEPDHEIIAAVLPGMATIPGAMLLCASSPHARKGALWEAFRRYYGQEAGPLVWKAGTRTMNPTVPQRLIDEAMERDPSRAAAEWGAEFRGDLETFLPREAIMACVEAGCRERAPIKRHRYYAFCDPSGGARDSMTAAVAHLEDEVTVVDALLEIRAPFDPRHAVHDVAKLFTRYGVTSCLGDRYGGDWPAAAFRSRGITYRPAGSPKSEIYGEFLPAINSRSVKLLDHPRAINQLAALERRTARGGKDSIDHPPAGMDDIANVLAGVTWVTSGAGKVGETSWGFITGVHY